MGIKAKRGTGGDIKEFAEFRHDDEVIRFNREKIWSGKPGHSKIWMFINPAFRVCVKH
jgi:hypothetical protein